MKRLTFSSAAKLKLGLLFCTFDFPRGDVFAALFAAGLIGPGAGKLVEFSLIGSSRNEFVNTVTYSSIHTHTVWDKKETKNEFFGNCNKR